MAQAQRKPLDIDPEAKARLAATIARVRGAPVDPDSPYLLQQFASILRERAGAGWTTPLSPETAMLVADALYAYAPKPPAPAYRGPGAHYHVDMFKDGSTVYRLHRDGEIFQIDAWARSTLVAGAAFDRLVEQYPDERFLQKRRSWVERGDD